MDDFAAMTPGKANYLDSLVKQHLLELHGRNDTAIEGRRQWVWDRQGNYWWRYFFLYPGGKCCYRINPDLSVERMV